jgi:hypothetical protein
MMQLDFCLVVCGPCNCGVWVDLFYYERCWLNITWNGIVLDEFFKWRYKVASTTSSEKDQDDYKAADGCFSLLVLLLKLIDPHLLRHLL